MMIRCIIVFLVIMRGFCAHAQQPQYIYRDPGDTLQNFYVVRLPEGKINGALVLINRGLSDNTKKAAYSKGVLLVTVVPSNNELEFLIDNRILKRMDSMIQEAIVKYKIPADKIVIGGMSVAGTAAIRFTEYCAAGKSIFKFMPAAVFAVDSPLDYARMYKEAENAILRNYNEDAVSEGKTLMTLFKSKLGGDPSVKRAAYEKASPYSHTAKQGGNGAILKNTHIRIYTEPDINWWINNRRKDFYDLNVLDIAALINQLKCLGNNNAELITTSNKGYRPEGDRHPHAWSIVDEDALLSWCMRFMEI